MISIRRQHSLEGGSSDTLAVMAVEAHFCIYLDVSLLWPQPALYVPLHSPNIMPYKLQRVYAFER